MGTPKARQFAGLAMATVLIAATTLVVRATMINRELRATVLSQNALASRTAVHDRLIGSRMPLTLLGKTEPPDSGSDTGVQKHLVWIVDTDLCGHCLTEGIGTWNALSSDPSLRLRLIVASGGVVPASARRGLRGTEIVSVSKEELVAALGPLLPNTKALVDGNGIILLADSRNAGSECGWSFDAQVGALRGVLASSTVRNSP